MEDRLPSYHEVHDDIRASDQGHETSATIDNDGRINVRVNRASGKLAQFLVPAFSSRLGQEETESQDAEIPYVPSSLENTYQPGKPPPPALNIVIHVVGSRGDVQPFIALGKVLQKKHHHRVRIATHSVFRRVVQENGLEFFNIGGDPSHLMAFMVKNPGLIPGLEALARGDVGRRRREIATMMKGCWRSCVEPGEGTGTHTIDAPPEVLDQMEHASQNSIPFVADAIIANLPSFAHIHCAEKLGVPLHMTFPMPWSPTHAFPHPLANIVSANTNENVANFLSYALVELLTWQGLADIINTFRRKTLGLEPVSLTWAPGMLARLRIPYTYCWSPALISKPRDWGKHIDVTGFCFLDTATKYTPTPDLAAFLAAGPSPIYVGFGSIVVDDPRAMTRIVFQAIRQTGQRALVTKGWGNIGADDLEVPDSIFILDNVPHDWLFKQVSCVVHHGGAGTTAAGISAGCPTVIIPFFGDQAFWGSMIARASAGPAPVPFKSLTAETLATLIRHALRPETLNKAKELSQKISSEDGSQSGARSFHKQLNADRLRCVLCPGRAAVWRICRTDVKPSAFAATVLMQKGLLTSKSYACKVSIECSFNRLECCLGRLIDDSSARYAEYNTERGPIEPVSGATEALLGTMTSMIMGIFDTPVSTTQALKISPKAREKIKQYRERKTSQQGSGSLVNLADSIGPSQQAQKAMSRSAIKSFEQLSYTGAADSPKVANQSGTAIDVPSIQRIRRKSVPARSESTLGTSITESTTLTEPSGTSLNSLQTPTREGKQQSGAFKMPKSPQGDADQRIKNVEFTSRGFAKFVSATFMTPMTFTLGIARGFHNAPRLYGDETVRPAARVKGVSSGAAAAGKNLALGFYDGFSGIVTQPLQGAKKEGAVGLVKGFGKGLGGMALKPASGMFGIAGYTTLGIYKELVHIFGPSAENFIMASRTIQGFAEIERSSAAEQEAVIARWKEIKPYVRRGIGRASTSQRGFQEVRARIWEQSANDVPMVPKALHDASPTRNEQVQYSASYSNMAGQGLHPRYDRGKGMSASSQDDCDDSDDSAIMTPLVTTMSLTGSVGTLSESDDGVEKPSAAGERRLSSVRDANVKRPIQGSAKSPLGVKIQKDAQLDEALHISLQQQRQIKRKHLTAPGLDLDEEAVRYSEAGQAGPSSFPIVWDENLVTALERSRVDF